MTRIKSLSRFAVVSLLVLHVAVPVFAARGSADFSRFVAIGDSYGSGVESGSLNERHQPYSWPAIVARQAGAPDFQQPLVSFPGIGNELQLVDVISFPPVIAPAPGTGQPLNLNLARPYNNLSVPGATVTDVTTLKGNEQHPTTTAAQFASFILRGLGTEVEQAIAQHPTFIAVWIGGNDVLGSVIAGTPKALTPTDVFRTQYNKMLDQLIAGAPNAGMVVGNLPTTTLPYMTTVPPVLINPLTRLPVLISGQQVPLIAELGDGTVGPLPAGSFVLLPYSGLIATGYGIPAALGADPSFAVLPNLGKPLLDAWVLTPAEAAQITARAVEFDQVIADAASARNIPVADIKGLFDRFNAPNTPSNPGGGYHVGPFTFNASFITGGLYSLDGIHLTDLGYTLFGNQFIRTINQAYGTQIPVAGISTLFANNGAFFPSQSMVSGAVFFDGMEWTVSDDAAKAMLQFASPVRSHKLRAAGH
jgi:lysophospholipase L1-like esterase